MIRLRAAIIPARGGLALRIEPRNNGDLCGKEGDFFDAEFIRNFLFCPLPRANSSHNSREGREGFAEYAIRDEEEAEKLFLKLKERLETPGRRRIFYSRVFDDRMLYKGTICPKCEAPISDEEAILFRRYEVMPYSPNILSGRATYHKGCSGTATSGSSEVIRQSDREGYSAWGPIRLKEPK